MLFSSVRTAALALTAVTATVLLTAAPAAAGPIGDIGGSVGPAPTDRIASCSSGNFVGELAYTSDNRNAYSFSPSRYRITKHNGQSGGSKANISTRTLQASLDGRGQMVSNEWWSSADAMVQDGHWHTIDPRSNRWTNALPAGHGVQGQARFVFDTSGWDPACTATWSGTVVYS